MFPHPSGLPRPGGSNDQPVFAVSGTGLLLALLFFLAFPGDIPAHGNLDPVTTVGYDTGNALLFLNVENIDDLWNFVEKWEIEGARFPHIYPPDLVIGDVPFDLERSIEGDRRVAELCRKPARPRMGKRADRWRLVTESWNRELEPRETSTKTVMDFNDILIPPVDISTRPLPKRADGADPKVYGCAYGADFYQTSEFIMGKVAVGVILPDGPGYAYDEDGIIYAHEGVRGAMQFWVDNVRYPGVRFVYRYHTMVPTTRNFQTIDPMSREAEWVEESMGHLGYTFGTGKNNSVPIVNGPVYEFIDSMRVQMRTEWGICTFIISASNGFGAGYTAYAHLGGPHLVCPSGHKGEITGRGYSLADLIIHESGHLFWALDEYYPGGTTSPCHERSGYLGILNLNSRNVDYTCRGIPKVPCTMNIPSSNVCKYTLGQMGVWDTDDDIIPDILDTHPYVRADELPDTITTVYPEIHGVAAVMPVINQCIGGSQAAEWSDKTFGNRNNITFNTIEHVIYRIDNAMTADDEELWLLADPEGGWGGDSLRIHFTFVPDSLTGGDHTIAIRGVNTTGNVSRWGEERIELFVKAIALHDFTAEPDFEGKVRLSYRIRGAAFDADATLYRRSPGGEEVVISRFNLQDDSIRNLYDSGFDSGTAFTYRLEASALGMTWNWSTDVISPAYIATHQYLSRIEPHPFRPSSGENLKISVRVPRGEILPRTSSGTGKPGGSTYTPNPGSSGAPQFVTRSAANYKNVRVDIHIYNLAGRFVKKLARFEAPEGFPETMVEWDGTNTRGEKVASGMYFILLKAGDDVWETRKVLLVP